MYNYALEICVYIYTFIYAINTILIHYRMILFFQSRSFQIFSKQPHILDMSSFQCLVIFNILFTRNNICLQHINT